MEAQLEETVEETQHLLVEFAGNTGSDALNQENFSISILGIDSDRPIITIGNQLYEGKFCDTIGTELYFTESDGGQPSDAFFDNKLDKKLEFLSKTNTKLVVSRAFAKPSSKSNNPIEDRPQEILPESEKTPEV